MEIKQRIQQYLDYKGISANRLENEVGLSNGYWRKTKSISAKVVSQILGIYSDLSTEWVMKGTGSMEGPIDNSTEGLIRMYQDLLASRDEKIRDLEQEIIKLNSRKYII